MERSLLFAAKRAGLAPRTAFRRRRETVTDPLARQMLELHGFSTAMYRFMAATAEHPELLTDADLDARSVVLDVGAYTGEWAERIAQRYGARVFAFEPSPVASRRLRERCAPYDNVETFEFGLSGSDRESLLRLAGPGSAPTTSRAGAPVRRVVLRDVVGVLDELGIGEIDLMKVNIEGGEYELFRRLDRSDVLRRIRFVSVQFHEWIPGAYRGRWAIRRALRREHDEVWNYPWVWELWRRRTEG